MELEWKVYICNAGGGGAGQIGVICGSKIVERRLQDNMGYAVLKNLGGGDLAMKSEIT